MWLDVCICFVLSFLVDFICEMEFGSTVKESVLKELKALF